MNETVSLSGLPSLASAKLPRNYQTAKQAVAECVRVDECKTWADKAAALASYGKQAGDDALEKMGRRIQARANARMAELLREVPPKGGKSAKSSRLNSTTPSRGKLARDAGLSRDQQITAMRVGNVPQADFERQVESDNPPSVTELARQGRSVRDHIVIDILRGRDPSDFKAATQLKGFLSQADEEVGKLVAANNLEAALRGMENREKQIAIKQVITLRDWCEMLIRKLTGADSGV